MGVQVFPWRWHILSIPFYRSSPAISTETCGVDGVFPPDDLGFGPYTQVIIIYMPCIISVFYVIEINSSWETYTYQELVWPWRCVGWYDTVILSCLISNVYSNCIVQDSLYHNMHMGTMWHCALVSCTPSQSIGLFGVCALFRCWVSLCVPFTNLLIEYFIMIIVTIIGMFMHLIFILNYVFRLYESK